MALLTFDPTPAPSPNPQMTPTIKVRQVEFGDGYTASSPDGLNPVRKSLELSWDALTLAQRLVLELFFETALGSSFYYAPHAYGGTPIKWTCREWSWAGTAPYTFRAKLEQSFTNET